MLAAEISTESLDTGNPEPMVAKALEELAAAGVSELPGVALADAGYWKNDAIEKIVNKHHIQTLIAPDADKRKGPRPGRRGGLYDHARQILATDWAGHAGRGNRRGPLSRLPLSAPRAPRRSAR